YTTNAVTIAGAGNVTIAGTKTETLVGDNTYTGSTTINSGSSLRIGWGGSSNHGALLGTTAVTNNGSLTFSNDQFQTFNGSITGTGWVLKEFTGTEMFTGAVSHTGGTTISGGTLQIGNAGTTGSITGNIVDNATLNFNRSDTYTYSGVISGTGAVAAV